MKQTLLALVFAFTAVAASALTPPKPILTKTSGGGFMMPEAAGGERCDIFSDRVIITHQYGQSGASAFIVSETRKLGFSGNLQGAVEAAKADKITETENMLCDGPSTFVSANSVQGDAVLLYSTGGCGTPKKSRQGIASNKLRSLIDLYCAINY